MRERNRGFTLIELMIVIAILAILLAIAVPVYNDYVIRTKVTEALNVAAPAKLAVVETFNVVGSVPDQATTGYTTSTSEYVDSITIANDNSGMITVTTQATGAATDPVFTLIPDLDANGPITWECQLNQGNTRHLPPECRPSAAN